MINVKVPHDSDSHLPYQLVLKAGLNASKAESINKKFVFGITTSIGVTTGLFVPVVCEELEDLLHAMSSENKNNIALDNNPIFEFKT